MSFKPSEKFIQVTAGLFLVAVSSFFLWKDTLKPIAKGLRKEGVLEGKLKQGLLYLTGRDESTSEDVLAREKEKLRREEQALQEKLEQLRKKRESLSPTKSSEPSTGNELKDAPMERNGRPADLEK